MSSSIRLFFGVGVGRCGTMAVANALGAEAGVICTHEGKVRRGEVPGNRVLPFLTLENRIAYEWPERAMEIFASLRDHMADTAASAGAKHIGDLAYNYAPFVTAIGATFPNAKLIVFVRSGVDFVRSATVAGGEDPTPVGWPPRDKPLSPVERYIELGRLAPRQGDPIAERWSAMSHLGRSAWLWAETNRIIFNALGSRPEENTYLLRFENFFRDARTSYLELRDFLELGGSPSAEALSAFDHPINRRSSKILGPPDLWSADERAEFHEFAGEMMSRLGYAFPPELT